MKVFEEIRGNFGFGIMRLPRLADDSVDLEQVCKMADYFIEAGFNYFDTAHGYMGGLSELAFRDCVAKRFSRDQYLLANKLSKNFFNSREDIYRVFDEQLKACGVDYFDFYLMHSQSTKTYPHFMNMGAYEVGKELRASGKIRHLGISFHDTPALLDQILTEHPEIEFVQIQFNYLDMDDPMIQSRANYDVCVRHNVPVRVMEPIRGGYLASVDVESPALLALRFAASFEQIEVVLSGMSTFEQLRENVDMMKNFRPLSEEEFALCAGLRDKILAKKDIPCTNCKYCKEVCPIDMPIPEFFGIYNGRDLDWDYDIKKQYESACLNRARASECLKCGACEDTCPQHIAIRDMLDLCVGEFE